MKTHVGNVKFALEGEFPGALNHICHRDPRPAFIHLFHPKRYGVTDTLSQVAWRSPDVKDFLVELTNLGYSAYMSKEGESRLVHRSRLSDIWSPLRNRTFSESPDGQIYEYFPPLSGVRPEKLLVIFSPVFDPPLASSLGRYFNRTFLSIQKFLPHNVAVLRLADVGGVLGAFYMNTRFRPDNEMSISRFLAGYIKSLDIDSDDVVLYGASKGGTGALAYGLRDGYRFVAVDPIVDDSYYHKTHNDLHFTNTSIFLQRKTDLFEGIYSQFIGSLGYPVSLSDTRVSRAVICSEGSPLYPYLEKSTVRPLREHVSFFKSRNPDIDTHPAVAQNTINLLTMLLNAYFCGVSFDPGVISVY